MAFGAAGLVFPPKNPSRTLESAGPASEASGEGSWGRVVRRPMGLGGARVRPLPSFPPQSNQAPNERYGAQENDRQGYECHHEPRCRRRNVAAGKGHARFARGELSRVREVETDCDGSQI